MSKVSDKVATFTAATVLLCVAAICVAITVWFIRGVF